MCVCVCVYRVKIKLINYIYLNIRNQCSSCSLVESRWITEYKYCFRWFSISISLIFLQILKQYIFTQRLFNFFYATATVINNNEKTKHWTITPKNMKKIFFCDDKHIYRRHLWPIVGIQKRRHSETIGIRNRRHSET